MSAVTDVQRRIRQAHVTRLAAVLGVALVALSFAVGPSPELAPTATVITTLLLLAVTQTRLIGTLRRRERELNRPRMTPEDYRRLREMEIELGWEPTEVPGSLASGGVVALEPRKPAACECGKSAEEHAREWDEQVRQQVLASQGIPPARLVTDKAAEHFAQLARVGRESCIGFCPMCAARDHDAYAFTPDDITLMRAITHFGTGATVTLPSGKRITGAEFRQWTEQDQARRWLEAERWGGNEH